MLGYVKAYKPEMTYREFDTYKAVYCALCRTIGKEYGAVMRALLSYDFTFLSLIFMSLNDEKAAYEKKRCTCNPLKKCNYCTSGSEELRLAAAVTVALCEYKAEDNIEDEGFFKSLPYRLGLPFLKRAAKKAYSRYPELSDIINEYKQTQSQAQKDETTGIDRAAEPSANALSRIFALPARNSAEERVLKHLGYCLGKWIYLLDAGEDFSEDIKKGRFNPLKTPFKMSKETSPQAFAKAYLEPNLMVCEVECEKAFELLDVKKYRSILQNILYLGMKNTRAMVIKGGADKEH